MIRGQASQTHLERSRWAATDRPERFESFYWRLKRFPRGASHEVSRFYWVKALPHALVMLGKQTKPTIDLQDTASRPVCLPYGILSIVPAALSLSSHFLCLCLSVFLLSLSLSRARASVLVVFCVRRFDRFADGGHRGFNSQMLEFCKALQEAHNRLLILLILLHCVFCCGRKRKGT